MGPPCKCHDEPQYWNKDGRYRAGGFWKCAVRNRARAADSYERMPGLQYQARLLYLRRLKALKRKAKRNLTRRTATNG